MNEEARPTLNFRYSDTAAAPDDFVPADWTMLKHMADKVAARHVSGVERKIPANWMEARDA